ncbi:hypothetical protein Sjap_019859 [Stephania japonica]|uniref:cytidine deaminase n=1 Tax=Stephania japonica TaxID=461633 RepID=A0AAP0F2A2_9MAGN
MDEASRFVIASSEVETMAKNAKVSAVQLLPSLVPSAQALARPPISQYHVGAVGLGSSGRVFLGGNVEFPGVPLHQSIHAEQFLVTNAALHSEPHLPHLAVSSAPCGHCRQFLQELRSATRIEICITSSPPPPCHHDPKPMFKPISHFLPDRFGPDDLLHKDVPLILEPHHNGLAFWDHHSNVDVESSNGWVDLEGELGGAALEAANGSHAPYSGCPSGVAMMDSEGRVYKGSYMESAAYNPSLGPVQAALVAYIVGAGGDYGGIKRVVLVEKKDAVVRQEGMARLLLHSISPHCDFHVLTCVSSNNSRFDH